MDRTLKCNHSLESRGAVFFFQFTKFVVFGKFVSFGLGTAKSKRVNGFFKDTPYVPVKHMHEKR